jgi:hypothetical protein
MSAGAPEHTTLGHARDRSLDTRVRTRGRARLPVRRLSQQSTSIHAPLRSAAHASLHAVGTLRSSLGSRTSPLCPLALAAACVHLSFRNVVSLGFGATGPSLQGADAAAASPIPAVPRQPQLGGPASCHPCVPHLHRDWGLTPATSAPGLGLTLPHLRRDWARPCPSDSETIHARPIRGART